MITHILVPLDGTTLAESALPVACGLARALAARITLMHVIERDAEGSIHGERHLTASGEAADYLAALQQRMAAKGLAVDCHVHVAAVTDVAAGIAAHQAELHPDLIVMCTHGPAGLARRMRGSLAQQVVALGETPLLLVRPDAAAGDFALRRLLVPVDGRPEHAAGFALALELAATAGAGLDLLAVIPSLPSLAGTQATLSRFSPAASQKLQELTRQELQGYLGSAQGAAEARGVAFTAEVRPGKVPDLIARRAEAEDADLIVMATHGKSGTKAFWANSVAGAVQTRTLRPLLLVPV